MLVELTVICQMLTATYIKKNKSVDEASMDYVSSYIKKAEQDYLVIVTEANPITGVPITSTSSLPQADTDTWGAFRDERLSDLLTTLASLFQPSDDYHKDFLRPTNFSLTTMWELLDHASLLVDHPFPSGIVYPDGDGGLRLEWIGKYRELRLIIPAAEAGRQYIYYEAPNGYGSDFTVTPHILAGYLNEFSQYERIAQ